MQAAAFNVRSLSFTFPEGFQQDEDTVNSE